MQVTLEQRMDARSKPAPTTFFLDDLSVGQRFSSASHTIDEAQIKAFAVQFDPQPFHLDDEDAKSARRDRAGSHSEARRAAARDRCGFELTWRTAMSGRMVACRSFISALGIAASCGISAAQSAPPPPAVSVTPVVSRQGTDS